MQKYIDIGNFLLICLFGLSFFVSLVAGSQFHHLLATIDLVMIVFTLHIYLSGQSLAEIFPPLEFWFLKGSVYLTVVGLYSASLGVSYLAHDGTLNFITFLVAAYASLTTFLQAREAYNAENPPLPPPPPPEEKPWSPLDNRRF